MAYHQVQISQCRQANERYAGETAGDCCGNPLPDGCNRGGWPEFDKYGFSFNHTTDAALSWERIQEQICAQKPIAFSWHWEDCASDQGHMMVVSGYKTTVKGRMVRVFDPAPTNKGDVNWHFYEYYLTRGGDACHWNDFYDIIKLED